MGHLSRRGKYSRSHRISGYLESLERVDAFLESDNPDLERARVDQAMILLFGEDPDGFVSPGDPDWLDSEPQFQDTPDPDS